MTHGREDIKRMGIEYKLVIDGRLAGINELIEADRRNRYKGSKLKRTEQDKVVWAILKQLRGVHIKGKIELEYIFTEPNKRRDLDNISGFAHKVIQDALVECRVIENDGWGNIVGYTDHFEVGRPPKVIVIIREVD